MNWSLRIGACFCPVSQIRQAILDASRTFLPFVDNITIQNRHLNLGIHRHIRIDSQQVL